MEQAEQSKAKDIKSFWAIAIIVVVGFVLTAAVILVVFNNQIQDQLNSLVLSPHRGASMPHAVKK